MTGFYILEIIGATRKKWPPIKSVPGFRRFTRDKVGVAIEFRTVAYAANYEGQMVKFEYPATLTSCIPRLQLARMGMARRKGESRATPQSLSGPGCNECQDRSSEDEERCKRQAAKGP